MFKKVGSFTIQIIVILLILNTTKLLDKVNFCTFNTSQVLRGIQADRLLTANDNFTMYQNYGKPKIDGTS